MQDPARHPLIMDEATADAIRKQSSSAECLECQRRRLNTLATQRGKTPAHPFHISHQQTEEHRQLSAPRRLALGLVLAVAQLCQRAEAWLHREKEGQPI
ncbi:hypothetical protein V8J88_03940 [Massilia sp. W12]|uniref:hypothetical protein n=1 Tax=Massilia sp. W12 TaxID=3126507 RepID=UPI0030D074D8